MGFTSFNTGIDRSIRLIDEETGTSFGFDQVSNGFGGNLMSFKPEPVINTLISKPCSNGGEQLVQDERNGWKGDFMVTRSNGDGESFEALQEAFYRATGRTRKYSIHETIVNVDGSTTKWIYKHCAVRQTSGGENKTGSEIEQAYSFEGGGRVAG